ncbi:osmolarity sensor protein EnvZ [Escherichia coli]|nr:osmolarity sensor protein EnvZ [Escherichia coli]
MRRLRFSPRSSFARTLLLIVTLLFVSLVTTYLVVLNFAILPSLQQFNKVLAYEVRMLMTDKLQLEDGTQLVVPPAFRREIYRELGISLYSNEAAEEAGLRWAQHYEFLSHQMAQQLGGSDGSSRRGQQKFACRLAENLVVAQYLGTRAANRNSSGRFLPAVPLYVGDYAIGDRRGVAVYSYPEPTIGRSRTRSLAGG